MVEGFVSGVVSENDTILKRSIILSELERKRDIELNSVMTVTSINYSGKEGYAVHKTMLNNLMHNTFPWVSIFKENLNSINKLPKPGKALKELPSIEESIKQYEQMLEDNKKMREGK